MRPGTSVKVRKTAEATPDGTPSHYVGMKGIVAQGEPATGYDVPVLVDGRRASFLRSELQDITDY